MNSTKSTNRLSDLANTGSPLEISARSIVQWLNPYFSQLVSTSYHIQSPFQWLYHVTSPWSEKSWKIMGNVDVIYRWYMLIPPWSHFSKTAGTPQVIVPLTAAHIVRCGFKAHGSAAIGPWSPRRSAVAGQRHSRFNEGFHWKIKNSQMRTMVNDWKNVPNIKITSHVGKYTLRKEHL